MQTMRDRKETIRVERLVTGYRDRARTIPITDGLDASLFSGELTCLLGPNGAGKSTLLKTLAAFMPPLSGDIFVEGKNIGSYTDAELARMIGVVLTERVTLNNMSAYELVAMGRSPYTGFWGSLGDRDREIIDEAIALVRIEGLRDRTVSTLSDGERQKVMIAKALAQETPIIFLDEPTAFLDYPSKVEMMQLLQRLSRVKGKTIFLSTHDLEIALQTADKIWLIDRRHGVVTGSPEDLALNGSLAMYFEREGVRLDPHTGLFSISHVTGRDIRLEGQPGRAPLVAKALARNGIRAAFGIDAPEAVVMLPDGYRYRGMEYTAVEPLVDAIICHLPAGCDTK